MMCVAAVTFSACSDDDDDDKSINVPESVVQALKQKYPSATGIEWEQKGTYFVADCWLDGKESNTSQCQLADDGIGNILE